MQLFPTAVMQIAFLELAAMQGYAYRSAPELQQILPSSHLYLCSEPAAQTWTTFTTLRLFSALPAQEESAGLSAGETNTF